MLVDADGAEEAEADAEEVTGDEDGDSADGEGDSALGWAPVVDGPLG